MTPLAQRLAIAEACGWMGFGGLTAFPNAEAAARNDYQIIPDYCNDLNAMHEAEKKLTRAQQFKYADLIRETNPEKIDFSWHCPAAQRAEAFLRTIGKWEEPTP